MSDIIVVPYIENYIMTFLDGTLYLKTKQKKMDEDELFKKGINN